MMNYCLRGHLAMMSLLVVLVLVLPGCAAQRNAPHMGFGGFGMEAEIGRGDIVVLDRVEGSSSLTTVLFPLVQIIDGDKLQILGIKFFKDKYVWRDPSALYTFADAPNRAYYKALEAHPEADAVFSKSWEREESGIPFLFHNETVTVRGKAIRLKADQ